MSRPLLQPTKSEARRLVAYVFAFWASFAAVTQFDTLPAWATVVFLGGFVAVGMFYVTVFRIAGRELERRLRSFFGPFGGHNGSFWQRGREDYGVLFRIADPRWWHRTVIPETGWPRVLVEVALLGALLADLPGALHP
jgi:hypothetical protein